MGVIIQTKDTPSSCSLQHGPSGCSACVSTCLSPWVKAGSLMCIDYCGQIDLPCINLFLDYRSYSARARQTIGPMTSVDGTYSGGFAGSIITASFVLSSLTR